MKTTSLFTALVLSLSAIPCAGAQQQDGGGEFELRVNPFTSESLHLYELRRKAEVEQIKSELGVSDAQQTPETRGVTSEDWDLFNQRISEIESHLYALESRINELPQQLSDLDEPDITDDEGDLVEETEDAFPHVNTGAVFYGTVDFGDGARALHYDTFSNDKTGESITRLVASKIGERAPRPVIEENRHRNGKVTSITEYGVSVDFYPKLFARRGVAVTNTGDNYRNPLSPPVVYAVDDEETLLNAQ